MDYQNQETSSRGRSNYRGFRKPSRSQQNRGVGRTRGFFNPDRVKLEADKLEEVRKSVEQTKIDSDKVKYEQQANPNFSKKRENINQKIELGKQFISEKFKGFVKPEKGNIKVTLDETIDDRLSEPYLDRIQTFTEFNYTDEPQKRKIELIDQFKGITNIGIANKLFHAAPEMDKLVNHRLVSLRLANMPLPKKMNLLINQMGKTDLLNDNCIRLKENHLLMKKFLCKGLIYYLGKKLEQYFNLPNLTIDVFKLALFDHWDHMIDKTTRSVSILKDKGKQFFLEQVNKSYKFKIGEKVYELKLPDFDFERDLEAKHVVKYFSNNIFTDFQFETADLNKLLGTLVFQVAKFNWFEHPEKMMKELNPAFDNTLVSDLPFSQLLSFSKIWILDDFLDPDIMDQLGTDVVGLWNNTHSTTFKEFFEMEPVKFSEFGTDAQLVEIQKWKKKSNLLDREWKSIAGRSQVKSVLKTTEQGALIGLSTGYSKAVEISSKFDIMYDSKTNLIFSEIIKSDFK